MHKQNQEIIARSPAVVKLLGEHAVVYGKLCIAAAVEQYANVKIEIGSTDAIELEFTNISGADSRQETTSSKIASIYNEFASRDSISKFLEKQNGENMLLLPCAVIIGRLNHEFDADIKGIKITFSSDIPMQYGLASSAALSTALVVALVKLANVKISNEKIIDIARDGERIIHENENAGRIDVNTSFYGNIVSFDAKFGANPHKLDYEILLMLIDTGPKKKTSEMVAKVAELYKKDKNNTEKILNKIDMCSAEGLSAIEKRDFQMMAEIIMKDSNNMHATMLDTWPPIMYLNDNSKEIIYAIHELNDKKNKYVAAYTFDAGANAHIITTTDYANDVFDVLKGISGIKSTIQSGLGMGPKIKNNGSLIDVDKLGPK